MPDTRARNWERAHSDPVRGQALYRRGAQCGGCVYYDWLYGDCDWGLCAKFNRVTFEHDTCLRWSAHPWGWERPHQEQLDFTNPNELPRQSVDSGYWWELNQDD